MTAPEITPRTVDVPIFQGDDLAKINKLRRAAETALKRTDVRRLGDGASGVEQAAADHDAFVEEAASRAVIVTLQALGRRQWRDMVLKHPPRDDEKADAELGFNVETLCDELAPASLTRPLSVPRFETAAQAEVWVDELADGDFQRLYSAAYVLNTGSEVPKAELSSRLALIGGETSTSPSRLGEASPSSTTSDQSETSG